MPTELLKACDLTVGYGSLPVLHEINFTIVRGDFLGVMGPNGSGKTTLLKTFLGLLKPLSGTIESASTEGGHLLFGYVPQRESLDFHYPLTALEVALMGRFGRIGVFRRPQKKISASRWPVCVRRTWIRLPTGLIARCPVGRNNAY